MTTTLYFPLSCSKHVKPRSGAVQLHYDYVEPKSGSTKVGGCGCKKGRSERICILEEASIRFGREGGSRGGGVKALLNPSPGPRF